ncbi:MAG: CD225/dispanin family protein [Phycisphaerales bacterium]|jgi:hypothetical protein
MNEHDQNTPQGGPAAPPPPQGYAASTHGTPSPTYLVPSILVTIFCCQILGIVAIVFSAIAMSKNSSGEYQEAAKAANTAKLWCWIGFGVGFVFIIGYSLLMVLGVFAGVATNP